MEITLKLQEEASESDQQAIKHLQQVLEVNDDTIINLNLQLKSLTTENLVLQKIIDDNEVKYKLYVDKLQQDLNFYKLSLETASFSLNIFIFCFSSDNL